MMLSINSLVPRNSLATFDFLVSTPDSLRLELEFVFAAVLFVSLIGGIVALAGMVLQKLLGRFLPNRLMYCFWVLIIFRFVLFFAPASPTSFLNLLVTSERPSAPVEIAQEFSAIEPQNYIWPAEIEYANAPAEPIVPPIELVKQVNYWQTTWLALQVVWLIGLSVYVMLLAVQAFCVYRLVKSSRPNESEKLSRILADARESTGVQSRVQLRTTNRMSVPAMVGLIHPTILLPAWCEHEMTQQQLKLIFSHELIHVRSRDGLVQLLAHLVTILHWFNPLVRHTVNQISMYRELSCDQQVLAALDKERSKLDSKGGPMGVARLYGETILQIAERCSNQDISNKSVAPEWIPGFIGSRQKMVIERIQMLDRPKQKSRLAVASGLACAAFLVAVGFTAAQDSQPVEPPPQSETSSSAKSVTPELVSPQENQPVNQSEKESNSFANADSVKFRVQIFEGRPDEVRQLLKDCGVETTKLSNDDMAMAGVLKGKITLIREQLNDYQQLFDASVSGRNKQKLRAESIKEIEIGSDNEPQTRLVGLRLEITPILQDEELIVECRIEESSVTYALAGNDGKRMPGFSVRRLNTGIKLKQIGDAVLLTQTMIKEQSKNKDDLFTSVYLIDPVNAFRADKHVVQNDLKDATNVRRSKPDSYKLRTGDSLKIYFTEAMRIFKNNGQGIGVPLESFKVDIGDNGKVILPDVGIVHVEGLTVSLAKAAVKKAYHGHGIMNPDEAAKVMITVHKARKAKDISGLRLAVPGFYATDAGDVLGMFIEGALGGKRPTVHVPKLGQGPPTIGSTLR